MPSLSVSKMRILVLQHDYYLQELVSKYGLGSKDQVGYEVCRMFFHCMFFICTQVRNTEWKSNIKAPICNCKLFKLVPVVPHPSKMTHPYSIPNDLVTAGVCRLLVLFWIMQWHRVMSPLSLKSSAADMAVLVKTVSCSPRERETESSLHKPSVWPDSLFLGKSYISREVTK